MKKDIKPILKNDFKKYKSMIKMEVSEKIKNKLNERIESTKPAPSKVIF